MKSSSISLFFEDDTTITDEATAQKVTKKVPYLINLVDSPGHIDFSSDVSAAVLLLCTYSSRCVFVTAVSLWSTQSRECAHRRSRSSSRLFRKA